MDWQIPERFNFNGDEIAWGVVGEGPPAVDMNDE